MDYLYRFIVGGAILAAFSYFTSRGLPQIAGLIMTFPVITIASLLMAPAEQSKEIAIWGLVGIGAFTVFIIVFLGFVHFNGHQSKVANLLGATVTWVSLATAIYYFTRK